MTQNEKKDLLLKDLCARLPYELKISVNDKVEKVDGVNVLDNTIEYGSWLSSEVEEVKPYLFPLSSMTEEQQKEYRKICDLDMEILENRPMKGEVFPAMYNSQDWLDAHHFDYRGLIPMGLAIDATGKNIY